MNTKWFQLSIALILLLVSHVSRALPINSQVITGDGDFSYGPDSLHINQHSQFMHSQFDGFDISAHETVMFSQPNAQAIAIAQVLSRDVTQVHGQLTANGQLFLVAPGGLVVHNGASIEAGSLFVAAGQLSNLTENEMLISHGSEFKNFGRIETQAGALSIFANRIDNQGRLSAAHDLNLLSADSVYVQFDQDLFSMQVQGNALNGMIENSGLIESSAGNINIQAHVREQFKETVIHNSGEISAKTVWEENGEIYLGANEGDIENNGLIEIENATEYSSIKLEAQRIAHSGEVKANAMGNNHGGRIELLAEHVVDVRAGSLLSANGGDYGSGGFIKVFSPQSALFRQGAHISAQAGLLAGDGGFVDVSGWQYIEINGRVSTLALNGINGQFLIDPYNVTISGGATNNDAIASNTYTPSSNGASINVTELQNNLKLGNVTVITTGAGAENGDISVAVAIDLDGTDGNTLALIADGSIVLNGNIEDATPATADATNITLQALGGNITAGINTVKTGGGAIELKTAGNITLGTGGNIDLTKFDSEGGSLSFESTAGSLTLLSDIDLDGYNGSTFNFIANGDVNLDFDVKDFTTASADSVNLGFVSSTGDVLIAGGKVVESSGGQISIEVASNITVGTGGYVDLALFNSDGGGLSFESTAGSLTLLSDIDLDGYNGSTFNFIANGDVNLDFDVKDFTTASADSVNLNFASNTGDINLAYLESSGGDISLIASLSVNDNNGILRNIDAGGGVVSFDVNQNIGGTSFAQSIEIIDSIVDVTANSNNMNVYLSNGHASKNLWIRDVDYNGGDGLNFNVEAKQGSDIIVSGNLYDSNLTSAESATFNLVTRVADGDITINDGATIRSGSAGTINLNSANDVYLTGVFGGSGGTSVTASNDIFNNGGITLDVQSTGNVSIAAGRHVADGDALNVSAGTLNLTLGSGNQNISAVGAINLGNIEVDGANGANLWLVGNNDINIVGSFTDANGADDVIGFTLGTSTPGFLIFPDAGYNVPGSLTFWSGTSGIKDSVDERVSITANSLISNGANFLLNTGPLIFDLTVDDIDFKDDSGSILFEINNSKDLRIIDIDGDGEFLLGKQFKLAVTGGLTVPNAAVNDVDDQLWIIANDMDDPDADNIITIRDSADAGSDFNLILDLTSANDVQVNTNASQIDGSVALGGILRVHPEAITNLSQDLNLDGSLLNGAGDIYIESVADVVLADAGLQTVGNLSLIADDVYDSDSQLVLSANDLFFSALSPVSLYTLDLTALRFDADVAADLTINTSANLIITDVDGDGFVVENIQNFKLDSTASLLLSALGLSAANSIWLNAVDVSDGDHDLMFNSADLYFSTSIASTAYQLRGAFNRLDYDLAGAQTDLAINVSGSLDLATFDGAVDGVTLEGAGDFTVITGGDLLVKDAGINTSGDIDIQVTGALTTQSNQAIILNGNNVSMRVNGASSVIEANLTAGGDLLVDINSALVLQGGNLNAVGDSLITADDIRSDTDRTITVTGNSANIHFNNQLASSTIIAQVNTLDAQGTAGLLINSLTDLSLLDIDGDGASLTGFQDVEVAIAGDLTLLDTGLQVAGDLIINAAVIQDSDNAVQLTADRLFVNYQTPLANTAYTINGTFNDFNAAINGDLNLNATGNVNLNDWNGAGQLLNSVQNLALTSTGTISIPATGLSAANGLWVDAVDLIDGNADLILNAPSLYFNFSKSDKTFVINTNANDLDGNLSGSHGQLQVNASNDLAIVDLDSDGNSLMIADGYGYFDVQGALQVNGNVEVLDAQNDGTVGGWLYLAYQGQADIGNASATNITADGSLESSNSVINPDASSQIFIQQTGALSASNGLSIGANLQAIGGDIVIDVTNGSNTVSNSGDITIAASASLIARNTQADVLTDLQFENFTANGSIQGGGGQLVRLNGYPLIVEVPVEPEVPDEDIVADIEDAVSDVINGSVGESDQIAAEDVQNETVAAVESTPNVNLALNEMFSGCRESNEQESRCKVKEEISRFLGRFLIGGSMPKSK